MAAPRGGKRNGAGRPKGVPNKITADVKAMAQQYGEAAIVKLATIMMESDSESAQIAAAKELLDRGYGKSVQSTQLSGPGGGPVQQSIEVLFGDDGND